MSKKQTTKLKSIFQEKVNYSSNFAILPDNSAIPIIVTQPLDTIRQTTWTTSNREIYQKTTPSSDIISTIKGTTISFGLYATNNALQREGYTPNNTKYTWQLDNSPISLYNNLNNGLGTDSVIITSESCTPQRSGEYVCTVANNIGSIQTIPFTLNIIDPINHPKLYKNLILNGNGQGGTDGWELDGDIIIQPFVNSIQRTENFGSFRLGGMIINDYGQETTTQVRPPFYFSNASHIGMFNNSFAKRFTSYTQIPDSKSLPGDKLTETERQISEGHIPQIIPNEDYNYSTTNSIAGFFPGIEWLDKYNKNDNGKIIGLTNEFIDTSPTYFTRDKIVFKNKGGTDRVSLSQTIDLTSIADIVDGNAYGITHATSQFFAYVGAGITNYKIKLTRDNGIEEYNYHIGTAIEYKEKFEANYSNPSSSYGITSYYLDTTQSPQKWLNYNEMLAITPESSINATITSITDAQQRVAKLTDLKNIKDIIIAATTTSENPSKRQNKLTAITKGNFAGGLILEIPAGTLTPTAPLDYIFRYNAKYEWSKLTGDERKETNPAYLLPDNQWPFWYTYKSLLVVFQKKLLTYFNYSNNSLNDIIVAAQVATPYKSILNELHKGFGDAKDTDWEKYYKDTQGGGDYNSIGADHIKNIIHPIINQASTIIQKIINDVNGIIDSEQETIKKVQWILGVQRVASVQAQKAQKKAIVDLSDIEITPILDDQTTIELIYLNQNNNIIKTDIIDGPTAEDVWAIKEKVYFPLTLYPLFGFVEPSIYKTGSPNNNIKIFGQKYTTTNGLSGFFAPLDVGRGTGPFFKGINSLEDNRITLNTLGLTDSNEIASFGYAGKDNIIRDVNARFLMNNYDFKTYGAAYPPDNININPRTGTYKQNSYRAVHDFGAAAMFGVELTTRIPKGARSVQIKVIFKHTSKAFEDPNPSKKNWNNPEIYSNEYGLYDNTSIDNVLIEYGNPRCGITSMKYIITANNFEKNEDHPTYFIPPPDATVLGLQKAKYNDPNAFNTVDAINFKYNITLPNNLPNL